MAATYREITGPKGHLATLTQFTGNSMTGVTGAVTEMGRLPEEWREVYRSHVPRIVFTVLSYNTPIGWALATGAVIVPDVRYSVTTSRQQSAVRAWLHAARFRKDQRLIVSVTDALTA